jgi:hypothetical protein
MNDIASYQQKNCTEKLLKHPSYKVAKGRNDPSRNNKRRGRNVRLGRLHFFIQGRPKRLVQRVLRGIFCRARPSRPTFRVHFGKPFTIRKSRPGNKMAAAKPAAATRPELDGRLRRSP